MSYMSLSYLMLRSMKVIGKIKLFWVIAEFLEDIVQSQFDTSWKPLAGILYYSIERMKR